MAATKLVETSKLWQIPDSPQFGQKDRMSSINSSEIQKLYLLYKIRVLAATKLVETSNKCQIPDAPQFGQKDRMSSINSSEINKIYL